MLPWVAVLLVAARRTRELAGPHSRESARRRTFSRSRPARRGRAGRDLADGCSCLRRRPEWPVNVWAGSGHRDFKTSRKPAPHFHVREPPAKSWLNGEGPRFGSAHRQSRGREVHRTPAVGRNARSWPGATPLPPGHPTTHSSRSSARPHQAIRCFSPTVRVRTLSPSFRVVSRGRTRSSRLAGTPTIRCGHRTANGSTSCTGRDRPEGWTCGA